MSFEFDSNLTLTGRRMTTTHKTLKALRVVMDSLIEFPCPLGGKSRPKPVVGLGRPEEVRYQGMPDKPRAYKARWDVFHPTCP